MKDGVTLEKCAEDYGRRCVSIGKERRNIADLQDAMNHPMFKNGHHRLLDGLAKDFRVLKYFAELQPWETIKLGVTRSVRSLRKELADAGCGLGSDVEEMIEYIPLASRPVEIDLYCASITEIRTKRGTWEGILSRLDELGFAELPGEAALQLRKQHSDQPIKEYYTIVVTKPIECPEGKVRGFYIGCNSDGPWISCYDCNDDLYRHYVEQKNMRLVFGRKEQLRELGL